MTRTRKLLLASAAIAVICSLQAVTPDLAYAAEVLRGGGLGVALSGFGLFRVHGGQLDNQYGDRTLTTGVDFSNDYELHVLVSGRHDAAGLEYGAHLEFGGDTDRTAQTDEEWLWLRGGFGELRFGDEDGVVDQDSIGAYTVAAATGGIDGDVISQLSIGVARPSNTSDSTKINYHTPSFGGLRAGLTFTPNNTVLNSDAGQGDSIALRDVAVSDEVEGSLVYKGDLAGLGVQASVVGSWGHAATPVLLGGGDTFWTAYGGATTTIFGFKVAGGGGTENAGGLKRTYANAGVGASYGPVNVSLTVGKVLGSSGYAADRPWIAVLGADVGLLRGLVLMGEVAYFDNDLPRTAQTAGGDAGLSWLTTLQLAF